MGRKYTAEQVVTLLREMSPEDRARVDARAGRNLDPRYVEHGRPCCLVAHLMVELGVAVETLRTLDQEHLRGSAGSLQLSESRHPFWRRFEPPARQLLEFLQRVQDIGQTWGAAADEALSPTPREWFGKRWARERPWLPQTD